MHNQHNSWQCGTHIQREEGNTNLCVFHTVSSILTRRLTLWVFVRASSMIWREKPTRCYIMVYWTCFRHCCAHHQEPETIQMIAAWLCATCCWLIHTTPLTCSACNSLLMFYETLTRNEPQYASRDCITSTDTKKLECTQCKFLALCHNCFFISLNVSYKYILKYLKLHILHDRRHHLDKLLFITIYNVACSFWISRVIWVRNHNFMTFSLVSITCTTSPSARCASASKLVCMDIGFCLTLIHFHRYKHMFLVWGCWERTYFIVCSCVYFLLFYFCAFVLCLSFIVYVCCNVSITGHLALDSAY